MSKAKDQAMSAAKDEHYIRAVTELGDTTKVVASQDIYSRNGTKLVAAGVCITSALYQHLVRHLLLKPLDMSLSAENMVDADMLWRDVQELLQKSSKLVKMVGMLDKGYRLRQLVAAIQLPLPLTFKLTVAREKFSDQYQHSLVILIMSVYLARCDGMSLAEEGNLAVAALFHDIGLLHIDPAFLGSAHRMNQAERRHLYAHPLSAYMLLREFPELPSSIAEAVLQHHEYMDGRGYPRGLSGLKISRYGQILAIAEISARFFEQRTAIGGGHELEVMLKLNSKQYGSGLVGYLSILWGEAEGSPVTSDTANLMEQAALVTKLFHDFEQHAESARGNELYDFAWVRLAKLKLELLDAGLNPQDSNGLQQRFGDDPECVAEYALLLKEAIWQFNALVLDISRHWSEEERPQNENHAWLDNMESLLDFD